MPFVEIDAVPLFQTNGSWLGASDWQDTNKSLRSLQRMASGCLDMSDPSALSGRLGYVDPEITDEKPVRKTWSNAAMTCESCQSTALLVACSTKS